MEKYVKKYDKNQLKKLLIETKPSMGAVENIDETDLRLLKNLGFGFYFDKTKGNITEAEKAEAKKKQDKIEKDVEVATKEEKPEEKDENVIFDGERLRLEKNSEGIYILTKKGKYSSVSLKLSKNDIATLKKILTGTIKKDEVEK